MIFLLMAVLLFQAMAMLRVTQAVIEAWGRYERARAWGDREDSVERCLAVFNHFFIIFSSFQGLWLGFEAVWVLFLHLARLQLHCFGGAAGFSGVDVLRQRLSGARGLL